MYFTQSQRYKKLEYCQLFTDFTVPIFPSLTVENSTYIEKYQHIQGGFPTDFIKNYFLEMNLLGDGAMTILSNICIIKIEEVILQVQISGGLENIKVISIRSSAREEVSNKAMEQTAVNIVQNVSKLNLTLLICYCWNQLNLNSSTFFYSLIW